MLAGLRQGDFRGIEAVRLSWWGDATQGVESLDSSVQLFGIIQPGKDGVRTSCCDKPALYQFCVPTQ